MSKEKRYRLEVKQAGAETAIEVPGFTYSATDLGRLLLVKSPEGHEPGEVADALEEAMRSAGDRRPFVVVAGDAPIEAYAIEVSAEMKEG